MTPVVFPDNTVFCNFAAVGKIDLLELMLRGRGRWTDVVAHEATRSADYLPDLRKVVEGGWMGEPIEVDDEAAQRHIEVIRRGVFGGMAEEPFDHLGESQTTYLIQNNSDFATATWVTDDIEAFRYARGRGIVTWETVDLFIEAVSMGDISEHEGFTVLQEMLANNRSLRVPGVAASLSR